MSRKHEPKRSIVLVRWFDASYQRGECSLDEMIPRVELESAGLLVCEDDESVSIALDRYDTDDVWRYIEHIPKVNIRSIKRLSI